MDQEKIKRNRLIILAILAGLVAIIPIIIYFFQLSRPVPNEMLITNLSEHFNNLPPTHKTALQSLLYDTVSSNTGGQADLSAVTATVRYEGIVNSYDADQDVYYGNFIVDIPAVRQSYLMSFEWSSDRNNPYVSQYGAMVVCLDKERLIYEEFSCRDSIFSTNDDFEEDVLMAQLPYSTLSYEITNSGHKSVRIKIILSSADERSNPDTAIERYKQQALSFIESLGANPKAYDINWQVERASLY